MRDRSLSKNVLPCMSMHDSSLYVQYIIQFNSYIYSCITNLNENIQFKVGLTEFLNNYILIYFLSHRISLYGMIHIVHLSFSLKILELVQHISPLFLIS